MQPDDIARYSTLSDPQIRSDGGACLFVESRPDLERDLNVRRIWRWDGTEARPFTAGPGDSHPRWSPDATRVAFLRSGAERADPAQLALIPAGGGEATVITDFEFGVEGFSWSPDGSRLAVCAVTPAHGWDGLEEEERNRRPRRVGRVPFRFDGRGRMDDRRRHLWIVDPAGGEAARCLTPGDDEEWQPVWRPDGEVIAALGDHHPAGGLEPGVDLVEVNVATGAVARLGRGHWVAVSYRPDGVLHAVGDVDPHRFPSLAALWRRQPDGEWTDLTGHLDRSVYTPSPAPLPEGPQWAGPVAFITLEDGGRMGLIRVEPDGTVSPVAGGDRVIGGATPAADGQTVAFVASSPTGPGEVFLVDGAGERPLTDCNGEFRRTVQQAEPQALAVSGEGGEIDGWVYLPTGEDLVPVLVNLHGGPAAQYGYGFFDEFQVYAAAGFAVLACNPRGSSGRGRSWLRGVVEDGWGRADLADVTTVVEAALARFPRLDRDRLGIMGGSYGGFLTAWVTAHQDRYRSAVVERALVSWTSFAGTSDIGGTFSQHYLGALPPDGWQRLWEASPLAVAHQITTPTLILHSEEDLRCPIEQAEQLFMALLRAGTPTEFIRFPGEGHELSRSGRPRHRVERFEAILGWHRRHLAPGAG